MWRNLPVVQYHPENQQASENWSSWFEHCGLLIGQIPGKSRKWLFVPISAVCVVSLHVAETLLPDVLTRHTTHTSKQNHGPKQNITKEIKPTCLIPSRHSWEHSTQLAQHWSRKTCTSLNNMINTGHTGWIDWRGTYFLVAPCLCAGTPRGSDGGGTGQSHDPCHHSPAWDIGFPSCPHVKHLLIESRVEVTKSCSAEYALNGSVKHGQIYLFLLWKMKKKL